MNQDAKQACLDMTADIVSAFVSNNPVRATDLAELIAAVHASMVDLSAPKPDVTVPQPLTPAVSIRKSITDDYLICLEDGKKFKSLKRHLQSKFGMTADDYRAKWGLPRDYPMVAPSYAAVRSAAAKAIGLGSRKTKMIPAEAPPVAAASAPANANEAAPATMPVKRRAAAKRVDKPTDVAAVDPPADAPAKRRGRPKKA